MRDGEWKFEFDLSYKNITKTYDIDKNYIIGSADLNIQKISLSPISMTITGISDEIIEVPAKIIMKDESVVDVMMSSGDKKEQNVRMSYILPIVINVDQIKSVKLESVDILIS